MVDDVKTPEERYLVFHKMAEPSSKKIKDQAGGDDQRQGAEIEPVDQSKLVLARPTGNEYNSPASRV
ncbi:MAG: hypothetical protein RL394_654 [Bacteroidota bacterium]